MKKYILLFFITIVSYALEIELNSAYEITNHNITLKTFDKSFEDIEIYSIDKGIHSYKINSKKIINLLAKYNINTVC